jgi:cold shock CspA family protein
MNRRTTKLEKGTRVSFKEIEGQRGPKAVDVRISE